LDIQRCIYNKWHSQKGSTTTTKTVNNGLFLPLSASFIVIPTLVASNVFSTAEDGSILYYKTVQDPSTRGATDVVMVEANAVLVFW
jgi:hypothetical protein